MRVWCFPIDVDASHDVADKSILDSVERDRAHRFVFARDRRRYVRAHAGLRRLLGCLLDVPPYALQFDVSEFGKPKLIHQACQLEFSLSHSEDLCVVAVAHGRSIGVDIETWHEVIDAKDVAANVFTSEEFACWSARAPESRGRDFLQVWTRKEAALKAVGLGLQIEPRFIEVGLAANFGEQLERIVQIPVGGGFLPVTVATIAGLQRAALAVAWITVNPLSEFR